MKLFFNFQQIHHIQIVHTTHKYSAVYKHLIAKSLQARSAGTHTHTQVIKLTSMKSIWVHEYPASCRQMDGYAHKYKTDICVQTRLSCLAEISTAGSITTTWQVVKEDPVW